MRFKKIDYRNCIYPNNQDRAGAMQWIHDHDITHFCKGNKCNVQLPRVLSGNSREIFPVTNNEDWLADALDHLVLYKDNDTNQRWAVSHSYNNHDEELQAWCDRNGLQLEILPEGSDWYSKATTGYIITKEVL